MDAYLRPLTLVETGEETSFPLVKILVVTALTVAATYGISMQFDFRFAISLFVACPLWLGVVIQLIRSASVTERNNKRLQEGPLVLGRIVQGHTRLYSPGVERGLASVVFSRDEAHRMDDLYLKDVAKRIRSAKESDSPADDLVDVVALVKQSAGRPVVCQNPWQMMATHGLALWMSTRSVCQKTRWLDKRFHSLCPGKTVSWPPLESVNCRCRPVRLRCETG